MCRSAAAVPGAAHAAQSYREGTAEAQRRYLLALSHLLLAVPKQVLLGELPLLLPMLLEVAQLRACRACSAWQALASSDARLRQTTLATLYTLTFDAPELVGEHLTTLIAAYLRLAQDVCGGRAGGSDLCRLPWRCASARCRASAPSPPCPSTKHVHHTLGMR